MACCLVGLLPCWPVGLLACWLVGVLACWPVGLLACWPVDLLLACWPFVLFPFLPFRLFAFLMWSLLPCWICCRFSLAPPPYHVFADISVGGCERLRAHTHHHRYLRIDDRVVGPKSYVLSCLSFFLFVPLILALGFGNM